MGIIYPKPGHIQTKTYEGTKLQRPIVSYLIDDTSLASGASLGNSSYWVTSKGSGAIQSMFSNETGETICGAMNIKYCEKGRRLVERGLHTPAPGERRTRLTPNMKRDEEAYVQIEQETPGKFELHPAYQRHQFTLPGEIDVQELIFVPMTGKLDGGWDNDPSVTYQIVEISNKGTGPRMLRVYGYAMMRGTTSADLQTDFDADIQALYASNASHPNWVRYFGTTAQLSGYEMTYDLSQVYDPAHVFSLSNNADSQGGDVLGALQIDLTLEPDEIRRFAFILAFSPSGHEAARLEFGDALNFDAALTTTIEAYSRVLAISQVITPERSINEGALWAKVNMLRCMSYYPHGWAFTNDPSRSSNVVARDAAWFAAGCNYFLPWFSRELLSAFARLQRDDGLIIEYFNAVTGQVEDYGFNINDNTPLFITAVRHNYQVDNDIDFLRYMYPFVDKSAECIISQMNEHGLVICKARGTGVYGICGWRNIIEGEVINGAVTEINAECYSALRGAALLARSLGMHDRAEYFLEMAEKLREAINLYLINPDNGMFYLNIDLDGNKHTDVTSDELFPVMLGVTTEEVSYRIISRLHRTDFWTDAGMRTLSRGSPEYTPDQQSGLLGGVWPGVTWWYAYAAAQFHPELMAKALTASFEHYAQDPKRNNTVPGQFSEWFDGESLENKGMRLSPWEPPRFLWATILGACGLKHAPEGLEINPQKLKWSWVGVRNVPYRSTSFSFFATLQHDGYHIYSTEKINTPHHQFYFTEDVSDSIYCFNRHAEFIAFCEQGNLTICIGNTFTQGITVPMMLAECLDPDASYRTKSYNSERQAWESGEESLGRDLDKIAVTIEPHGYRILHFEKKR